MRATRREGLLIHAARAAFTRLDRWLHETPRRAFTTCGANVILAPYVRATHPERVSLGRDIYIGPRAFLSSVGGLTIEDGVIIGPYFSVYTANHRYMDAEAIPYDNVVIAKPVRIRQYAWIGGNVVVAPGVTVGEGAVVAAGAVLGKDVPDLAVVGGNPAKVLKYRSRERYECLKAEGRVYLRLRTAGHFDAANPGDAE